MQYQVGLMQLDYVIERLVRCCEAAKLVDNEQILNNLHNEYG